MSEVRLQKVKEYASCYRAPHGTSKVSLSPKLWSFHYTTFLTAYQRLENLMRHNKQLMKTLAHYRMTSAYKELPLRGCRAVWPTSHHQKQLQEDRARDLQSQGASDSYNHISDARRELGACSCVGCPASLSHPDVAQQTRHFQQHGTLTRKK